jgi:rhamnosyltransferase
LYIADKLNQYDIIGHFHTKKTSLSPGDSWLGKSWLNDIFELLIVPANTIIAEFGKNEKLGIVIPDIPIYYRYNPWTDYGNKKLIHNIQNLWGKMSCKKPIDFHTLNTMIMPYGTMFWYRPKALTPLFNTGINAEYFPPEPINNESTAHCIERILVYTAWSENFDFRIMEFPTPCFSAFLHNEILTNKFKLIISIKKSRYYFIIKFILNMLRFIKKLYNLLKK